MDGFRSGSARASVSRRTRTRPRRYAQKKSAPESVIQADRGRSFRRHRTLVYMGSCPPAGWENHEILLVQYFYGKTWVGWTTCWPQRWR